jgi:ubiquinone/menaquinone biosynthesis C-methylase UbiE
LGMLRQASPKSPGIAWVQADAAELPFSVLSFDFISCQFAFHQNQATPSRGGPGVRSLPLHR